MLGKHFFIAGSGAAPEFLTKRSQGAVCFLLDGVESDVHAQSFAQVSANLLKLHFCS